jgi:hypothetical protein
MRYRTNPVVRRRARVRNPALHRIANVSYRQEHPEPKADIELGLLLTCSRNRRSHRTHRLVGQVTRRELDISVLHTGQAAMVRLLMPSCPEMAGGRRDPPTTTRWTSDQRYFRGAALSRNAGPSSRVPPHPSWSRPSYRYRLKSRSGSVVFSPAGPSSEARKDA